MSNQSYRPANWEKIVATIVAVSVVALVAFLVIRDKPFSDPNLAVFVRILLSLGCAVLGAVIPGFLHVDLKGKGLAIRAGGALALFVITFFFSPPIKVAEHSGDAIQRIEKRLEMLEASIKLYAVALDDPSLNPRARSEFQRIKTELEQVVEQARTNPDTLSSPEVDVALVVAHDQIRQGATGTLGGESISEFEFNSALAPKIVSNLTQMGLSSKVFYREANGGSAGTRSGIASAATHSPQVIIELHANAINGEARGSEALVRTGDPISTELANAILDSIESSVGIPKRAVRTISEGDRGSAALYASSGSALILETFFIDNKDDLAVALNDTLGLAKAISTAISTKITPNKSMESNG